VLENIGMAISEREGSSANLWRPVGTKRAIIDEALDHLESLRLVDDALKLVRELPYGRQRLSRSPSRWRSAARAAARRAGGGRAVVGKPPHPRRGGKLDPDIAILIIEHDMDVCSARRESP